MTNDARTASGMSDWEQERERMLKRLHDSGPNWNPISWRCPRDVRPKRRRFVKRFGMTLTARAIYMALKERDSIPTDSVFLELMLDTYLEKYRDPPIVIPSEEELIRLFEQERERRDGK